MLYNIAWFETLFLETNLTAQSLTDNIFSDMIEMEKLPGGEVGCSALLASATSPRSTEE